MPKRGRIGNYSGGVYKRPRLLQAANAVGQAINYANVAYQAYRKGRQVKQMFFKKSPATGFKDEGGVTVQKDARTLYSKKKMTNRQKKYFRKQKKLRKFKNRLDSLTISPMFHIAPAADITAAALTVPIGKYQAYAIRNIMNLTDFNRIHADHILNSVGKQDVYGVAANDPYGEVGTYQTKNIPFILKNCHWELTIAVDGGSEKYKPNHPVIVEVYYCKCRRDNLQSSTVLNLTVNDMGEVGAAVLGETKNVTEDEPSLNPFLCQDFTKYFQIVKVKQFEMNNGATTVLNGNLHWNKLVSKRMWNRGYETNDNVYHKKGLSWVLIITVRDATYQVATDTITYQVSHSLTRNFKTIPLRDRTPKIVAKVN